MNQPHFISLTINKPVHIPVLLRETLQHLDLCEGLMVVDGTVGAGGHSHRIADRIGSDGTLIGLDRDPMMLEFAKQNVSGENIHLFHSSYSRLPEVLAEFSSQLDQPVESVDRILLDLGLSSDQLADSSRGFGFDAGGPLDMRFDVTGGEPAADILNNWSESDLETIFNEYGDERFSRQIAGHIVKSRKQNPVRTAADLVDRVVEAIPGKFVATAKKNPATRVFQALRIAANRELEHLQTALDDTLLRCLKPGGVLVVITFHSLEDRIVKNAFRSERWQNLTPKPISPTPTEQRTNPRSRTARIRTAMKPVP